MKYLFSQLFLCVTITIVAQSYQGFVNEDYQIQITKSDTYLAYERNPENAPLQLAGFPLGFRADPNTKNFRNVTLADINSDNIEEILFSAGNKLMAYSNNTLVWEKSMTGVGIYPPSVADIDNDGDMEIVQVTGGNGQKGRVYAMDHEGNNLPGFPKSYNDHWILTTAALSDLDNDGQLEIIFLERNPPGGNVHILNNKGESWSNNWPIRLPGTPAITPSIGDIDNDGEKEIVVSSTTVLYAFNLNGQLEEGWPVEDPNTKFSFQSPILADIDGNQDLEIIGAAHGIVPEYYVLNHDGTPYKAWPFFVPEQEWTFSTPSVVKMDDQFKIFMSRPKRGTSLDMLYAWNEAGDLQTGFPIENEDGLEGIISIANIDEDEDMEVIFGSNRLDEAGLGFIHAFNMDGSGAVAGFPLRTQGWTLLNGAAIGDVDNDGQMDLTALSYTTNFGAQPDSVFLNTYNLGISYAPEKILWSTYKGSNNRDGNLSKSEVISSIKTSTIKGLEANIQPNPIFEKGIVQIQVEKPMQLQGMVYTISGQFVDNLFDGNFAKGAHQIKLPNFSSGVYFLKILDSQKRQIIKKIIATKN